MTIGKTFEQYKSTFPEDRDELFAKLLDDLFQNNEIPKDDQLPVFFGTVSQGKDYEIRVIDISTINGYSVAKQPFQSNNPFSVMIPQGYSVGEKVIFNLRLGKKQHLYLFFTNQLFSFKELGLSTDSSTADIYGTFCEHIEEHKDRIKSLLGLSDEMQKTLDSLSDKNIEYSNKIDKLQNTLDNSVSFIRRMDSLDDRLTKQEQLLDQLQNKAIRSFRQHEIHSKQHEYKARQNELTANDINSFQKALKYEYEKETIIQFLTALHTSQIIILCGKPGIGKTTFAGQMAKALGAEFHLIEVQNNWTDRSDILGYYNPVEGFYQSTDFLDALLEAYDDNENNNRLHFICLDEMNLARIEYYFASFLSLLQRPENERDIKLLPADTNARIKAIEAKIEKNEECSEKEKEKYELLRRYTAFPLPSNLRFVGTMNIDESTNMLSPKVIDRSFFVELHKNAEENKKYKDPDKEKVIEYYPAHFFMSGETVLKTVNDYLTKEIKIQIGTIFARANPRLIQYAKEMCVPYLKYKVTPFPEDLGKYKDKDIITAFMNMIAIAKILPACTSQMFFNEVWKDILGDENSIARIRFQKYIEEHQNDQFVTNQDHWSFWE